MTTPRNMRSGVRLVKACSNCLRMSSRQPRLGATSTLPLVQQKRNRTIIMERVFPLPPGKDGGLPEQSQMNEVYKILRHVEIQHYPKEIECILTDFVEGVGIRGDLVTVDRRIFHSELFPAGLAVYASPENVQEFEEERKAKGIDKSSSRLGVFARMTMKELAHLRLEIPMNENTEWTLSKQHVQVAFRTQGIEVEENCITLPEDPITAFQDLELDVRINNLESVTVKATVVPISQKFATK